MNLIRSPGEFITLLVFLAVLVVVPLIFVLIGSLRGPVNSSLRECPHCGAGNDKAKKHCYACGYGFTPPEAVGANATLIQRVKQADDSKKRRKVEAQAAEDIPA